MKEMDNIIEYIRSLAHTLHKAERLGEEGSKFIAISDEAANKIYEDLLMLSNKMDNYR